jgi:hypothetical protein
MYNPAALVTYSLYVSLTKVASLETAMQDVDLQKRPTESATTPIYMLARNPEWHRSSITTLAFVSSKQRSCDEQRTGSVQGCQAAFRQTEGGDGRGGFRAIDHWQ